MQSVESEQPNLSQVANRFDSTNELLHLRRHIEEKIGCAVIDYLPFPHFIIEDFFPDKIYREIQTLNPYKRNVGTEWISKKESQKLKTGTPYHARKQINFHMDEEFEGSAEEIVFWKLIKDCFLKDHWFENLIYQKWSEYFLIRYGGLATQPDFFEYFKRELFLQRHEPGYYIGPHTDIPTRVFTCIFSFAERNGSEEFGTQLLAHKDKLTRCWGNNHYPPDDFLVEKLAPYKPNNFLLFFKTRQSFHAVKAIDDTVQNQRYGMQFQLYEPFGGLFKDLSAPDLLTSRHKKEKSGFWVHAKAAGRALLGR